MIKVDENNNESEIGKKRFPLDEITSQEEYTVQITIPEIDDEEQEAAQIHCKIVLLWSDYEFFEENFEEKKKKSESKLKKLNEALNKTNFYLKNIKEIYGELNASESIYNNTYNNINNQDNNNNFNNQPYQDNRYTDDKQNLNINNYSKNENYMPSP